MRQRRRWGPIGRPAISGRRRALGALLLLAAGCATARPKPIVFPPQTIVAHEADRDLWRLNDAELLAKGRAAFARGDFAGAARAFDRGCDAFPESPLRPGLCYDAGLARVQQHEWSAALDRFRPLADPDHGRGDALDAASQEATCLYFLEDYAPAADILGRIAERSDLPEEQRIQARVDRAICLLELSRPSDAEHELRRALVNYRSASAEEELPADLAGKAEFFMGEIYRVYFEAVTLHPETGDEGALGQALEEKAEELLSAQGHYLRAIRLGSPHWATGAGYRIGALYQGMYDTLVHAPLPPGLDAEQAAIYREELRRRIRVLVIKAISIYDETLAAADRIGEENPFVSQTKASLARMKAVLLDEPAMPAAAKAGGAGR